MLRLADQVRELAVGYADVHTHARRPRAMCEFDGERWTPIDPADDVAPGSAAAMQPRKQSIFAQTYAGEQHQQQQHLQSTSPVLQQKQQPGHQAWPLPTDSAYSSAPPSALDTSSSGNSMRSVRAQDFNREEHRRSSVYYEEDNRSDGEDWLDDEQDDVVHDLAMRHEMQGSVDNGRRVSMYASPSFQRNLISFADLSVSEVDLSGEDAECDLQMARLQIVSAFPKQFAQELSSPKPLTTFSLYTRSEDTCEMLHVVLVLEHRKAFWKLLGTSDRPLDKVTRLPYIWAADLDLPPLSLDEPRIESEHACMIMGEPTFSTIPCDNHNDECRRCKGLASEDDCFACEGSGIFKKKPCVMCTGKGRYFCKTCSNTGHLACATCGSSSGPRPILRQAFIHCARETLVSPTMEVDGSDKMTLLSTAKALAKDVIEGENFGEGTLPVAACGVVIRQRGHIVCATDIASGARGLFEVVDGTERVTFKGQLKPIAQSIAGGSIRSQHSSRPASILSGFSRRKKDEDNNSDDGASIRSTASSRAKKLLTFWKK
ncbi:hypothetical protein BCR37DRAFT_395366 [Protomyces lactucae-debilis]|uniref:Uncharacterized protein n=1 Tax=Protomyces lactucae-debilis TaxID=2754530 RepID=A0A1Y2EX34_PROLT|nr:uncharacterized protein BCR37DRAFT_395366 [Protomyces lactucae-debilis]ORY76057.1 hypothetical protein BCR37DRAFT_395366 [Protomyces lactucae-debilis]